MKEKLFEIEYYNIETNEFRYDRYYQESFHQAIQNALFYCRTGEQVQSVREVHRF